MAQTDGGWLATDARKARIDCGLIGAQAELNEWRPGKEGPAPAPGFTLQPSHGVFALISAIITGEISIIVNRSGKGCKAVANPFAPCN